MSEFSDGKKLWFKNIVWSLTIPNHMNQIETKLKIQWKKKLLAKEKKNTIKRNKIKEKKEEEEERNELSQWP